MVLEDWGVGHAAVEVLHPPLLAAFGQKLKVPYRAQNTRGQSSRREADGSYIRVQLSPHLVSGGCLTGSDWRLWYAICDQKMPLFGDDWQAFFYCWNFLSSNGSYRLRGVRVQGSLTVRKEAEGEEI